MTLREKSEEWIEHVLDSCCDCSYQISFEAGYRAALKDVADLAERDTRESPNLHVMILAWLKELGE